VLRNAAAMQLKVWTRVSSAAGGRGGGRGRCGAGGPGGRPGPRERGLRGVYHRIMVSMGTRRMVLASPRGRVCGRGRTSYPRTGRGCGSRGRRRASDRSAQNCRPRLFGPPFRLPGGCQVVALKVDVTAGGALGEGSITSVQRRRDPETDPWVGGRRCGSPTPSRRRRRAGSGARL